MSRSTSEEGIAVQPKMLPLTCPQCRPFTYRPLLTSYPIHQSCALFIPWYYTTPCTSNTVKISVKWDSDRTIINSATLHARCYSNSGAMFFDYFMNTEINPNPVITFFWDDLEYNQWREGSRDVLPRLINGDNYFTAQACKEWGWPGDATVYVTGELILEFTGEEPVVPPPTRPREPWEIPLYMALGIAGIVGVGYLISTIKR